MGQLQSLSTQLDSLGFRFVAIAPDPPDKLAEMQNRTKWTSPMLSDVDFAAAKAFGIAFKPEGQRALPAPAVFVIASNGRIQYQHVNPDFRDRLDPEVLTAMVRASAQK